MKSTQWQFILLGFDVEDCVLLLSPYASKYGVRLESRALLLYAVPQDDTDCTSVERFFDEVCKIFGQKLIAGNLGEAVVRALTKSEQKVGIAESCTGGLLAHQLTSISGASAVFDCGIIAYANDIKERVLGVDSQSLMQFGAVSEVVVAQMCEGILRVSGADFALATSGVAGPSASEHKPVGLVFIGVKQKGERAIIEQCNFGNLPRAQIQCLSVQNALALLLRHI